MRNRVSTALAALLLILPLAGHAVPLDFGAIKNDFGSADRTGRLRHIIAIRDIDCGDGLRLPLQFIFSTDNTGALSAHGWRGWRCPVLESQRNRPIEKALEFLLPGGDTLYFSAVTENGQSVWKSSDKAWTATSETVSGGAKWTITRWDGWQIGYDKDGNIESLTSDRNRTVKWERVNSLVTRIYDPATNTAYSRTRSTRSRGSRAE